MRAFVVWTDGTTSVEDLTPSQVDGWDCPEDLSHPSDILISAVEPERGGGEETIE